MTTQYNDDYTNDQRDLYVHSHGVKVATITVINGTVWYTNELDNTEYVLLEIEKSGVITTSEPVKV
jgi:hypothetical protein